VYHKIRCIDEKGPNFFHVKKVSHMRVVDLQEELRNRGLPATGNKSLLLRRVRAAEAAERLNEEHDGLEFNDAEEEEEAVAEKEDEGELVQARQTANPCVYFSVGTVVSAFFF
jgi:hypothetical protein